MVQNSWHALPDLPQEHIGFKACAVICVFYIHPGCLAGRRVYISISAWQIATQPRNQHPWPSWRLCIEVDRSHSLLQRVLKLRSWKVQPKHLKPRRTLNFSLQKKKEKKSEEKQQHRMWPISIGRARERERAWLSAELPLSACLCRSPLTFQLCLLEHFPPSTYRSHSFNQHSESRPYIFSQSDANVLSHCHIFIFTSADALGRLFQILLRAGYWGVIDVAAVLWLQG